MNYQEMELINRIASALERIASALEKEKKEIKKRSEK